MSWTGSAAQLLCKSPDIDADPLQSSQPAHAMAIFGLLHAALRHVPAASGWHAVVNFKLMRLGRSVDAVLILPGAILVLRVCLEARAFLAADRRAVEDAALDLADFHTGCRGLPVIPILIVPNGVHARRDRPLPLAGATGVVEATRLLLPQVLLDLAALCPPVPHDPAAWANAAYCPVPSLIAAACLLYARHDVTALTLAQAGRGGLARTAAAVDVAVRDAQAAGQHLVIFVTGAPGAGKTLCGLNLAFGAIGATFLTGNPTLVHVLREALVRDAAARGMDRRAAQQRMAGVIQALPTFRDHYVRHADVPPERLVVIDEAQRCWTASHAISKTRNRPMPLQDSEPGYLLDAMARHPGWAVVVCLSGGGQEIHDGEGGLAGWGAALATRPGWRAVAAPCAGQAVDPRQRLAGPRLGWVEGLHLAAPVRAVHAPDAVAWVEAVLAGNARAAMAVARAAGGVAFPVTRALAAQRPPVEPRGARRSGLVGSSGARRLRAEGLGATLPHQDENAVARWFLDTWPDIRASDALEVMATEFCVQGLELDRVGVCWDLDLVQTSGAWQARSFRGSSWTRPRGGEARSNRLNAYRVLLTRARHGTVIWVPCGDVRDRTRDPAEYNGIAAHLLACGAAMLDGRAFVHDSAEVPEPVLI